MVYVVNVTVVSSFLKNNKRNNSQFEKLTVVRVCRECKEELTRASCPAVKYLVSESDKNVLLIRHVGIHTCSAIPRLSIPADDLEKLVSMFPKLKAVQVKNIVVKKAIQDGSPPSEVQTVAAKFVNREALQRGMNSVHRKLNPHGNSVTAVSEFVEQLKETGHDEFFVPVIRDSPPCMLTTSSTQLDIAAELSGVGANLWVTYSPYSHIDFQPSRVTGMTTLGAQCYHPNVKKVIPLFKFYAED